MIWRVRICSWLKTLKRRGTQRVDTFLEPSSIVRMLLARSCEVPNLSSIWRVGSRRSSITISRTRSMFSCVGAVEAFRTLASSSTPSLPCLNLLIQHLPVAQDRGSSPYVLYISSWIYHWVIPFNCGHLTRAWPGGGVWRPPSRIFAIAQKRTALSTWNFAGLLIQQFDIVRGNFFEIRRKFFEIWSILWRHYTPLLVENWPNFAGLWKTQFLMKTQMKNTKRRKMRSSTTWLSRFFKILGFWPLKFQKIDFFGKWSLKSKIFKIFKNRNICYSSTSRLPVYKISSQ